jgi:hypothetical protein
MTWHLDGPPIGPHLMTWQVKELSLKLGVVSMYGFFEKLGLEARSTPLDLT